MKPHLLRILSAAALALIPAVSAQAIDMFGAQEVAPVSPFSNRASCITDVLARPLALEDAIVLAGCSHPHAQKTWANVRAHAEAVGLAKAAYWPTLSATVGVDRDSRAFRYGYDEANTGSLSRSHQSSAHYQALNVSWVLFDFGRRGAHLRQARELLAAADAARNDALQTVLYDTARAYYAVRDAEASVDAACEMERIAKESLAAARAKHDAGVGTLGDRLQAQTTYRRATLDRVNSQGNLKAVVGALAVSMGLDANTPLRLTVSEPLGEQNEVTADINALIDEAKMRQPKLAIARAELAAAHANVEAVRAQARPTISMSGSFMQSTSSGQQQIGPPTTSRSRSSRIGLQLTIPLFDGFASSYRVAHAQSQADVQASELHDTELQVSLDVWTSYQALKADAINLTTTRDLLDDARRSLDIARGRYQEGVGTLFELLTAQTALTDAQKQRVLAVSKWRTARLGLAASLGRLNLRTIN